MDTVIDIKENKETIKELSDYVIKQIHCGMLVPNQNTVIKMAREIRKWRGEENPDLI